MCIICSTFNPIVTGCEYATLTTPPTSPTDVSVPVNAEGDTILEVGDAAGDTSTMASIDLGEYFMGELTSPTDVDWIKVTLDAGDYTIAAMGVGPLDLGLYNTSLWINDSNGNLLYSNNSEDGLNAEVTFTLTETTTLYIDVASATLNQDGYYGVSVTEGDVASFNAAMGAGILMRPDASWATTAQTSVTITWAFRDTGDTYHNSPNIQLDANQQALTLAAMAYIDAISGVNFVQVNEGGFSNDATILLGAYDLNDGSGAFAYYPGSTAASSVAGDVWLNNQSYNSTGPYEIGSYGYFTMLHELGHALGLAHPGDYNAALGVSITYANSAQFIQDSHQYTVMSYFDETNTNASSLGYSDTFMLYDYLAIHALYGADETYHGGDTVYGFNATHANTAYDFSFNTTPLMTVYDGAGTDTIDLSGYTMAQYLTLEQGVFSNLGGYVGNFSIAYGAVIENAIGGSGDDTILGNDEANVLDGGEGADSIDGNEGADTIFGGTGNDTINGGSEFDLIEGGDGFDLIRGGMGNDTIYGGRGSDRLNGGNGHDYIEGGMGNDLIVGGRGNDTLLGGNRNDKIVGGDGEDNLFGGSGNDTLRAGGQNDYLNGGSGDDYLFGGAGFDTLIGGEGDDTMSGNFNADTFIFADNFGNDVITDFDATNDFEKIDFSNLSTLNSLADVLGGAALPDQAASQQGNDVLIDTGDGNSILLTNVLLSDLDAADFIF